MLYDDKDRCTINYRENYQRKHSAITVILSNILDKPIEKRLIPTSLEKIPSLKILCNKQSIISASISTITYDGFGRVIKKTDPMGNTIHNQYDALGHLSDVTDPVGNRVHRVYNLSGKVVQLWLFPVTGGHYLLSSSGYNADDQLLFKTAEDGKKTVFTYTNNGLPATIKKPSGHIFSWQYNLIDLPVTSYVDDKILIQSNYDPVTRQLIKKTDITGTTTWMHSIDGLPQKLIHTGKNNYPNYKLMWYYDNNRINIGVTDIDGNITKIKHDKFGRTIRLNYIPINGSVKTLYTVSYDSFSRRESIHYGSGMYRKIHYDDFGRQNKVTDTLNDQLISSWQFNYDADNNIIKLNQQAKDNQYAVLNYQYDALDNLTQMHCQGSPGLPLCPRDTAFKGVNVNRAPIIIRQNYFFTPLNRLARVCEISEDLSTGQTLNKTMVYSYNKVNAPLRLQTITTMWNHNTPVIHHFNYDISGNMIIDGEGNHILYNAFNQIIQTTRFDGKQGYYAYDGGGLEVMEKTTSTKRYFFYLKKQLINEKIFTEKEKIHIIGYQGMARTIDNIIHEYEEHNYKSDVVGVLTKTASANNTYKLSQRNIYSPYGMVWHAEKTSSPLYLQNLHGFDGQQTDPVTGWQFLGAGHRTYNPQQRYFVSEDPFGDGYAFCSNNPIMKADLTGNHSDPVGYRIFSWLGLRGDFKYHPIAIVIFTALGLMNDFAWIGLDIVCGQAIPAVLLTITTTVTSIFPLIKAATDYNIYHKHPNYRPRIGFLSFLAFFSNFTNLTCSSTIGISVSVPKYLDKLFCSGAGRVLMALFSKNESIFNREAFTELGKNLSRIHPRFFKRGLFTGDTIRLNCFSDIVAVRSALKLYDEDIGIAFVSASLKGKPLNIVKLEALISAKKAVDNDLSRYRSGFRNLMSDFATSYRSADTPAELHNIFPTKDDYAAVLVRDNEMIFVSKEGNNLYSKLLFNSAEMNFSANGSANDVLANFMSNGGKLLIDEYFRLDR